MQLACLPDRVLPPPGRRPLPEPVALRRMIGPSVILAGLSIGSGELILWPRLTAEFGFALFWACWIGVGLQYFLNMAIEIDARFGSAGRLCFLGMGVAVLFSTELALLDAVSRVAADLLKIGPFRRRGLSLSRLYFAVLWALIALGAAVLLSGFDHPFLLLVLSAALNGIVMFLYAGLLLWLNLRSFRGPLRPHPVRVAALVCATAFFGYFSVLTLIDQIGG